MNRFEESPSLQVLSFNLKFIFNMIYLIKTNYGVMSLLKIGYTNDLESRLKTYKTHNPRVELLSSREGGSELEHFLHEFFVKYSYSGQPEWFYFNDYIVDNFLLLENYISKEMLISILNHKLGLGKQSTKDLEGKYIEKYGDEDFQLRKYYLHRFWNDLNESLSEYLLESSCQDKIPIDSIITIKDLPFELGNISLNLLQILGRQKIRHKFTKNTIEFYYKTTPDNNNITQKLIDNKLESIKRMLSIQDNLTDAGEKMALADTCEDAIKIDNYKSNYISVDRHQKESNVPVLILNDLVMIAEQRAFEIQRVYYKDRFSVLNRTDKVLNLEDISANEEVNSFFKEYDKLTTIEEKLKYICKTEVSDRTWKRIEDNLADNIKNYLVIGKDRIKACDYNITNIKKELRIKVFINRKELDKAIYNTFEVGKTYSKANAKIKLKKIYNQTGYEVKAKASDLANWFEIKNISIRTNRKVIGSIKIIKKRD